LPFTTNRGTGKRKKVYRNYGEIGARLVNSTAAVLANDVEVVFTRDARLSDIVFIRRVCQHASAKHVFIRLHVSSTLSLTTPHGKREMKIIKSEDLQENGQSLMHELRLQYPQQEPHLFSPNSKQSALMFTSVRLLFMQGEQFSFFQKDFF
jgi:hypothetical protein